MLFRTSPSGDVFTFTVVFKGCFFSHCGCACVFLEKFPVYFICNLPRFQVELIRRTAVRTNTDNLMQIVFKESRQLNFRDPVSAEIKQFYVITLASESGQTGWFYLFHWRRKNIHSCVKIHVSTMGSRCLLLLEKDFRHLAFTITIKA